MGIPLAASPLRSQLALVSQHTGRATRVPETVSPFSPAG